MNLDVIAPFGYKVPPDGYGGTEAIVARQAIGYMERGHRVTVYAAEGSVLPDGIEVVTVCEPLLKIAREGEYRDLSLQALKRTFALIQSAQARGAHIDIIDNHFHPEPDVHMLARELGIAAISTLHGRLDADQEVVSALDALRAPLVSISKSQREDAPHLNYIGDPVYHGVAVPPFDVNLNPGKWALTIARAHKYEGHYGDDGRPMDEKGIKEALMLTREWEIPYKLIAKVDWNNQEHVDFFNAEIKPLIEAHPHCEYFPEVSPEERDRILEGTRIHISLPNYREAFGLAPVEAGVAGVPTLGTKNGALVETIKDGVNGYLCDSWQDAVAQNLLEKLDAIDRQACRDYTAARFTIDKMIDGKLNRMKTVLAQAA